jgi:hypothetical protein
MGRVMVELVPWGYGMYAMPAVALIGVRIRTDVVSCAAATRTDDERTLQ